jgi:outer membrane protein
MRCGMSERSLHNNFAIGCAILTLTGSAAAAEPRAATEREVVVQTAQLNPSLRSALIQLRDADWAVSGEEGRYPWVLGAAASGTRTVAPRISGTGVINSESYVVSAQTQLSKRLPYGTDLVWSLSSSYGRSLAALGTTNIAVPSALSFNPFPASYNIAARFSITQPLLRGSSKVVNLAGLYQARAARSEAERGAERVASALLRDVLIAYWELWYASAIEQIQEQSRALASEQRDQAKQRVATGSLAPADVLPFETRVATREEDVVNARVEVDRLSVALAGRIGSIGRAPPPGLPSEDVPPEPPVYTDAIEREVLERSPELAELAAAVELARVQRESAGDASRARLDADAYVQVEGLGNDDPGAALKQFGTHGAVSAHAGLTFESPLDSRRRTADVARANMAIELASSRLEEKRQQVLADVRSAVTRAEGARTRLTLAIETTEVAERQLEAERQRFATGSSTPLQVLQAEDDWRSARLRIARARVDWLEQAFTLDHLAGRLLEHYGPLLPKSMRGRPPGIDTAAYNKSSY